MFWAPSPGGTDKNGTYSGQKQSYEYEHTVLSPRNSLTISLIL